MKEGVHDTGSVKRQGRKESPRSDKGQSPEHTNGNDTNLLKRRPSSGTDKSGRCRRITNDYGP